MASSRRFAIAGAALLYSGVAVADRPVSAAQAMRAHTGLTSIGRDPCRPGAMGGDEIVVCARRESPYALPLYEAPTAGDGLMSGMDRELAVGVAQDTGASCHARGEVCTKPLPVYGTSFGWGKKRQVSVAQE